MNTNKKQAEKCLRIFKQKSSMYKYNHKEFCLSKVWNRGMGLLETICMYPDKQIILVNSSLWTKRDERVLQSILTEMEMEDWKRETRYYGYPVYYNNQFGLHLRD